MQSVIEKLELIERVHHLIRRRATGTPAELAARLDISEAKVYRLMELMKNMGAPLVYDFTIRSYYYKHLVDFKFGFKSDADLNQINGGFCSYVGLFKNNFTLSIFESGKG